MFKLFSSRTSLLLENTQNTTLSPLFGNYAEPNKEAVITLAIESGKSGQVKFAGSWWTARCRQGIKLALGEIVYVVGRHNITLYVEPAPRARG